MVLAQCYWIAKDLPNAKLKYKAALAKQPDDLATLRGVAEFDEATGEGEELEKLLRKVLKLDPKASWASKSLALRISAGLDPSTWAEAWAWSLQARPARAIPPMNG